MFTVKFKGDGSLERYKAMLVAKGYTQTYGVDYQETFAYVAKMNTVRILLYLDVNFDWELQQYDVKKGLSVSSFQDISSKGTMRVEREDNP